MRTVTVTEKDNNSKVELNKGDTLAVIFDFSPGTGYSWQIAKNDVNVLEPEGEPVISGGETTWKKVKPIIDMVCKSTTNAIAAILLVLFPPRQHLRFYFSTK